jgi:hypothetical protein
MSRADPKRDELTGDETIRLVRILLGASIAKGRSFAIGGHRHNPPSWWHRINQVRRAAARAGSLERMMKLDWKASDYFQGHSASLGALGEAQVRCDLPDEWRIVIGGYTRNRNKLSNAEEAKAKAEAIVAREARRLCRLFARQP